LFGWCTSTIPLWVGGRFCVYKHVCMLRCRRLHWPCRRPVLIRYALTLLGTLLPEAYRPVLIKAYRPVLIRYGLTLVGTRTCVVRTRLRVRASRLNLSLCSLPFTLHVSVFLVTLFGTLFSLYPQYMAFALALAVLPPLTRSVFLRPSTSPTPNAPPFSLRTPSEWEVQRQLQEAIRIRTWHATGGASSQYERKLGLSRWWAATKQYLQ
jgi:hypothetical protein